MCLKPSATYWASGRFGSSSMLRPCALATAGKARKTNASRAAHRAGRRTSERRTRLKPDPRYATNKARPSWFNNPRPPSAANLTELASEQRQPQPLRLLPARCLFLWLRLRCALAALRRLLFLLLSWHLGLPSEECSYPVIPGWRRTHRPATAEQLHT